MYLSITQRGGLNCEREAVMRESRDFFYLILLEKNARPVCETRRPKKKNNASEIRVWVHLRLWCSVVGDETVAWTTGS
jgi:hypothetical protein